MALVSTLANRELSKSSQPFSLRGEGKFISHTVLKTLRSLRDLGSSKAYRSLLKVTEAIISCWGEELLFRAACRLDGSYGCSDSKSCHPCWSRLFSDLAAFEIPVSL